MSSSCLTLAHRHAQEQQGAIGIHVQRVRFFVEGFFPCPCPYTYTGISSVPSAASPSVGNFDLGFALRRCDCPFPARIYCACFNASKIRLIICCAVPVEVGWTTTKILRTQRREGRQSAHSVRMGNPSPRAIIGDRMRPRGAGFSLRGLSVNEATPQAEACATKSCIG